MVRQIEELLLLMGWNQVFKKKKEKSNS